MSLPVRHARPVVLALVVLGAATASLTILSGARGFDPTLRVGGQDRYATAALVSQSQFPDGARTVYVASGEDFPDALAASAAAAVDGGPLLLVRSSSVPASVEAELLRLAPQRIVVVGGTKVISEAVLDALRLVTTRVSRVGGFDRFDTAARLAAQEFRGPVGRVFIVNGTTFPDALATGSVAGIFDAPVILTTRDRLPGVSAAQLAMLRPERITVVGGPASVSEAVMTRLRQVALAVERVAGDDRYETAVAVSRHGFGAGTPTVFVSSGESYADGLTAGPAAHAASAPLLLVQSTDMPSEVVAELDRLDPEQVVIVGGVAAISESVVTAIDKRWGPPSHAPRPSKSPKATPSPTVSPPAAATPGVSGSPSPTPTLAPTPKPTPLPTATTTPSAPAPTATPTPSGSVGGVHIRPGDPLQARIDAAAPGTVFTLHAGSYSKLKLRSGITLQAAGDGEAIITGGTGSWDAGLWIKEVSNVTIRGLTIRGNTLGIFLRDAPGALIENNIITDNAFGLEIHARTTGTIVRNNRIENNDRYLDAGRRAGGMNLFDTYGGITIAGNEILKNDSVGIEIYGMDDAVIERNVIAGSDDAIETGAASGRDCKNNRISHNAIYRIGHRPEERGMWLRCMSASLVAHNTIVGMDKHAIGVTASGDFSGPITNLRILNNAISNGRAFWLGTGLPGSVTIDYNNARPCTSGGCPAFGNVVATQGGTNYSTLSALQSGTPYMDHGLSADPQFIAPGAGDFRLTTTSPLIDRGTNLGWGHAGAAPDIGRHEGG